MSAEARYPVGTRVVITDVTGLSLPDVEGNEIPLRTPDISKPHVGKEGQILGYAEIVDEQMNPIMVSYSDEGEIPVMEAMKVPVIRLIDGTELLGTECWWEPVGSPLT